MGLEQESFTMNAGSSITTSECNRKCRADQRKWGRWRDGTAGLQRHHHRFGWYAHSGNQHRWKRHGGDITQTAGTMLDVGTGTINLTTPAITGANIGSSGANILTTAGTITASTGTSEMFITESDGANVTATATGGGRST